MTEHQVFFRKFQICSFLALYNLNRYAFFVVFALCRIATIPRYWVTAYNVSGDIAQISNQMIGILFVSGAVLGEFLN